MTTEEFQKEIRIGIPDTLPEPMPYDKEINHAPKRKEILTAEEKRLALRWVVLLGGIFAVVLMGVYGPGVQASEFVYMQF